MKRQKYQKYNSIFVFLYFFLNIFNTYFLTTQLLNRYISPLPRTAIGEITAVLGNFSVLFFIYLITIYFAKTDKRRQLVLLITTIVLNIFILLSGYLYIFIVQFLQHTH